MHGGDDFFKLSPLHDSVQKTRNSINKQDVDY